MKKLTYLFGILLLVSNMACSSDNTNSEPEVPEIPEIPSEEVEEPTPILNKLVTSVRYVDLEAPDSTTFYTDYSLKFDDKDNVIGIKESVFQGGRLVEALSSEIDYTIGEGNVITYSYDDYGDEYKVTMKRNSQGYITEIEELYVDENVVMNKIDIVLSDDNKLSQIDMTFYGGEKETMFKVDYSADGKNWKSVTAYDYDEDDVLQPIVIPCKISDFMNNANVDYNSFNLAFGLNGLLNIAILSGYMPTAEKIVNSIEPIKTIGIEEKDGKLVMRNSVGKKAIFTFK
ncbi:MAG: hypothetical protein ACRDDZ_00870 [Marinifilaceae bacterium]